MGNALPHAACLCTKALQCDLVSVRCFQALARRVCMSLVVERVTRMRVAKPSEGSEVEEGLSRILLLFREDGFRD